MEPIKSTNGVEAKTFTADEVEFLIQVVEVQRDQVLAQLNLLQFENYKLKKQIALLVNPLVEDTEVLN